MEKIIKSLLEKDEILLSKLKNSNYFQREIEIDNFKIVWFVGLRWVWKTTFLLQQREQAEKSIYISLDDLVLKNVNIFELIKEINKAYKIAVFYLDEIQFINDWQMILKNIYDFLDVKVIFSWSSMIDLLNNSIDLSRRVIINKINIFSYKEFENIQGNHLENISLNEIIDNSFEVSKKFSKNISFITFKKYLEFWQFGYYFEYKDENVFKKLLQNSIKKSIYEDLVKFIDISSINISKIEDLLIFISSSVSSEISINSLSNKIGLNNITVSWYLDFLEKLGWIVSIQKYWNISESLRKEKKFYLTTTNLLYLFSSNLLDESIFKWNLRETFVISNLFRIKEKYNFKIFFKSRTDLVLVFNSWKILEFEIWWKSKKRNDVKVIKDGILIWDDNTIPLYLMWLLK